MSLILDAGTPEWRAGFAWTEERGGPGLTVRRFRKTFALNEIPQSFVVHVSADSRYVLYANGRRVGRGPAKGTVERYHFETYDLAGCLQTGDNVIAAEVRWFGVDAPCSEVHSATPGFLFQGPEGAGLDTPGEWKVQVDTAVRADTTSYISNAQNFLGHMEIVDLGAVPKGWLEADFDDSAWQDAVYTSPADINRLWGEIPLRDMTPRDMPLLVEDPRRFVRTIRDKREIDHLFGDEPAGWRLAPGESGEIVLDAGCLTTGYPVLRFSGGADREVRVTYGEAILFPEGPTEYDRWVKKTRDDFEHGEVYGYRDTVRLGCSECTFECFHWRTFWFIGVAVSTGSDAFTLEDASYRFTTYPQTLSATFESSDPDTAKMLELSWRTLQLCAHETYEDCPYYEQLNYIADTRLQAICSMALAGQSDLARRVIALYRHSVRPDGLVQSRVPSVKRQILPYFALIWVLMVEDYWRWVGPRDRDFVRSNLHTVDGILWFFRERLREDGFVGHVPHWNMVDGADEWHAGEPPAILAGESTYLTLLYAHALDAAKRLHREAGAPLDAERWLGVAERVRGAAQAAWSEEEGLFLEGPGRTGDRLSQHSQVFAILTGAATPEQTARIMERLTSDPALIRMKFMQSYYLGRALEKVGAYEAFSTHVLEPYRRMLGLHLTTWCEYLPGRSDCHAWSSWIAADFVTCVLGIKPGRPGFEEVVIAPQTGAHEWARGSMPTPAGTVSVEWSREADTGAVSLAADVPVGVPVEVRLPGAEPMRFVSGGPIEVTGA